jgi:iron complex transport system permease protein
LLTQCAAGLFLLLVLTVIAPLTGGGISLARAFTSPPWAAEYASPDALIFWGTRVPRVLAAILTGAALGLSGLAFQSVLRNPLAEPYILGISAGAGIGKAVAILLFGQLLSILGGVTSLACCFLGALFPLIALQMLAARQRNFSPVTLLLAGVMLNVIISAVIPLIQAFASPDHARQIQLWWLGSLDVVGYHTVLMLLPFVVLTAGVLVSRARAMNVLSFDPVTAASLGLEVNREVHVLLWLATLLASAAVAVAGPIGFVGLIVPHLLRQAFGADNRLLAPLCPIYGAAFLLLCDLLGWRGPALVGTISINEIPVGVVTALVGGPLFLYMLIRRHN